VETTNFDTLQAEHCELLLKFIPTDKEVSAGIAAKLEKTALICIGFYQLLSIELFPFSHPLPLSPTPCFLDKRSGI